MRADRPSTSNQRLAGSLLAACLALLGSACDHAADGRTPGQKLDTALAKGEQKLDHLKAESGTAGERLSDTARQIGDKVEALAGDAGITARVKAKLATDPALNALKINADTSAGRVTLAGVAPDQAAKERATALTLSVDGAVAVDNQLQVVALPR